MTTQPSASGVIVADDDPIIRGVLRANLEAVGQTVFLASDGGEAIELASRMQASLVVLDIAMPKLDGIYACARIRCLPGYATTPIVILTLDDSDRAREKAARAGATMLMDKPFGPSLMPVIAEFLSIDPTVLEYILNDAARAVRAGSLAQITRMRSCCTPGEPA